MKLTERVDEEITQKYHNMITQRYFLIHNSNAKIVGSSTIRLKCVNPLDFTKLHH